MFLSYNQIEVQKVQLRSIRPIRGRIQSKGQELSTRQRISLWLQGSLFVLPTAAILLCGFLSASRADLTGGEVQTGKLACMDEHHYLSARA